MIVKNILIAIASLMFIMIGADKFFKFLQPPCSLESSISPTIWTIFGILQLAAGVLIWFPKFRKFIAGFFALFMFTFTIIHLINNQYDVGGSAFMAVLLGLIFLNPNFLKGKKTV